MTRDATVYVAGHQGLVGSAITRSLQRKGYLDLLLRTHTELDLTNQAAVNHFFSVYHPEYVFLAAAKVGGIAANNQLRGQFIYENLQIQNNVIHAAWKHGVRKLLFLGSTCIYPREAPQPMSEDCLLTSPLEYTNEPYAIAKIAGLKLCESYNLQYGTNFLAVMPTNLYGPNDNFDLERSHVLPALLRKIYLAGRLRAGDWAAVRRDLDRLPVASLTGSADEKTILSQLQLFGIRPDSVEIWGTGRPLREFLWSEEMAEACVFIMEEVDFKDLIPSGNEIRNTHINIGTGQEISIRGLAELIARTIGYSGHLVFNAGRPDGAPRKLTDPSLLHRLGWHHLIDIDEGVARLYEWYIHR